MRMRLAAVPVLLFLASSAAAGERPRVVKLDPPDLWGDTDAGTTQRLTITFDQPMSTTGFSWCGGGPSFPPFKQGKKPFWKDARTCVAEVALEPDRVYRLSLNCPGALHFRSARGAELAPTPWTFATLPAKPADPREQRKRNQKALDELVRKLEESYSYHDLKKIDWPKLWKQHSGAILATRSERGWAGAAGKALEPTGDMHLGLRYGSDWFVPAGRRSVDPLYSDAQTRKKLAVMSPIERGFASGMTSDGIAYVLIATWMEDLDIRGLEEALSKLRGSKAMVVDVRLNHGGDENLARGIAQWFVKDTVVYSKNRIRTGKGKDGFSQVFERKVTGNTEAERRFDGPIAVLISPYIMSSCESFVLMLEQAPDSTTVGVKTWGSSGNPKPHELSNGVTVLIPCWEDQLPDGTILEGRGIEPDVPVKVEPKSLERDDPILEKGLEVLRKKLEAK